MSIRDDFKHQVQQQTDIVDLVGEQLALKPAGREFKALCPFHDDKNPSMSVVPHKQIYHCFVCGAGGDAFSWQMKFHRMTFPEALKSLAERLGLEMPAPEHVDPARAARAAQQSDDRHRIADANSRATAFFQALLHHPEHGKNVRDYLAKRGMNDEMVKAFGIGYAPDRWDGLMTMIRDKRWDTQAFAMAGLIKRRDSGDHYDALRHRLIFPIYDTMDRPIAFGGRKLRDEDEPKYLNSPETPLFNKSATLYGIHRAKTQIIASKTAVIVEGYTDVIACHQHGITNVVATLGTAFTSEHAHQLRRYCEKVVLIFDADEAGKRAADRAIDAVQAFIGGTLDVMVAVLPGGMDPDELLGLPDGHEQWQQAIDGAVDALAYQFERLRMRMNDAGSLTGRQRLTEQFIEKIASMGIGRQENPIRRSLIVQQISSLIGMSEHEVNELIKRSQATIKTREAGRARFQQDQSGTRSSTSLNPSSNATSSTPSSSPSGSSSGSVRGGGVDGNARRNTGGNAGENTGGNVGGGGGGGGGGHEWGGVLSDDAVPATYDAEEDDGRWEGFGSATGGDDYRTADAGWEPGPSQSLQPSQSSGPILPDESKKPVNSAQMRRSALVQGVGRAKMTALRQAQRHVIGAVLARPELFHEPLVAGSHAGRSLDEALIPDEMIHDDLRCLYQTIYQRYEQNLSIQMADLLAVFADPDTPHTPHTPHPPHTPSHDTPPHTHDNPHHSASFAAADAGQASEATYDLAALATSVEAEADRMTDGRAEAFKELLAGSVETLSRFHQEKDRDRQIHAGHDMPASSSFSQAAPTSPNASCDPSGPPVLNEASSDDSAGQSGSAQPTISPQEQRQLEQLQRVLADRKANPSPVRIAKSI